LNYSPTTT